MKTIVLSLASLAVVLGASGCGFAARSPEMYRDDTKAVLDTKSNDIRACYDGILKINQTVAGRVTLKFDVENEQGKITNVQVDKANTTAPQELTDCVTKSIVGLGLTPPDARLGQGSFTWEFAVSPSGGASKI